MYTLIPFQNGAIHYCTPNIEDFRVPTNFLWVWKNVVKMGLLNRKDLQTCIIVTFYCPKSFKRQKLHLETFQQLSKNQIMSCTQFYQCVEEFDNGRIKKCICQMDNDFIVNLFKNLRLKIIFANQNGLNGLLWTCIQLIIQ